MLNISRLFLLAFTLLLSSYSFADKYKNTFSDTLYDSAQAACQATVGKQHSSGKINEANFTTYCSVRTYYWLGVDIIAVRDLSCEKKYDSGMFWGATSAPATFCDGSCEWQVEKSSCGADYNQDGTFTGASSCAYSAETNGNTCSTKTGTPQNPTPNPPPPLSPCGPGKTAGVINGTTICVSNDSPPPNCEKLPSGNYNCVPKDPNNPPKPPDPNNPPNNGGGSGCTSNCNNTTNNYETTNNTTNNEYVTNNITNNTTEASPPVDLSPVIEKLNQVDTGIKALDSAIKSVGTAVKAVETAINTTTTTITNAINSVKDKVTDVKNSVDAAKEQAKNDAATQKQATDNVKNAVDQAKEQAKTDAAAQKQATDDQTKQDKEYQDWQKENQKCKELPNVIDPNATSQKTVNSEMCKFTESFEDYKKWMRGEGEDADGNSYGLPKDGLETPSVPTKDIGDSMPGLDGNLINYGKQCPSDKVLSMPGFGGKTFSYTFKFSEWCNALIFLGLLVKVMAYLHAGYIVLGASRS